MYQTATQQTRQPLTIKFEVVPQSDTDYVDTEEQFENTRLLATPCEGQSNRGDERFNGTGEYNGPEQTVTDNAELAPLHLASERANNPGDQSSYLILEDVPRPDTGNNEQDITNNSPVNQPAGTGLHSTWTSHDLEQGGYSFSGFLETRNEGKVFSVREAPNYKPWVFRSPFMGILLLLILISLGLVELAVYMLPDGMKDAAPAYTIYNSTASHLQSSPIHVKDTKDLQGHQIVREESIYKLLGDLRRSSSLTIDRIASISSVPPIVFTSPSNLKPVLTGLEPMTSNIGSLTSSIIAAPRNIAKSSTTYPIVKPPHSNYTSTTFGGTNKICTEYFYPPLPTTTVEIVTMTIGPEDPSTTTGSSKPLDDDCDTTLTETYYATGHVTVGLNTVTVDLRTPIRTKDQKSGVTPTSISAAEPISTCYYTTVTETSEANILVVSTTTTVDITVLLDKRQPPLTLYPPPLVRQACISGGVFTVTENVAELGHTTITEFNTVTVDVRRPSITVDKSSTTRTDQPPLIDSPPTSATDPLNDMPTETSNAQFSGSTENRQKGGQLTSAITTKDGPHTISISTKIPVDDHETSVHSPKSEDEITTMFSIITTDENGKTVTSTKTTTFALGTESLQTTTIAFSTVDKDGNALITTTTHLVDSTGENTESVLNIPSTSRDAQGVILTAVETTLTNSNGEPTLTSSMLIYGIMRTTTVEDSLERPTDTKEFVVFNEPETSTFINSKGEPMTTATLYMISQTNTLTDENGEPTITIVTVLTKTPSIVILTNTQGSATATWTSLVPAEFPTTVPSNFATPTASPTNNSSSSAESGELYKVYAITHSEYFTGLILPTLLATALSIPIRILSYVAKLYQPFHALASTLGGSSAYASICFKTLGIRASIVGFQSIPHGQYLLPITDVLVALSAILVPLSSEIVRVILQGDDCHRGQGNADNCAITIGVFPIPAMIAVAVLVLMAVLIILAAAVTLWRYRTGVRTKPWSLLEMSRLASEPEFRDYLGRLQEDMNGGKIRINDVVQSFEGKRFTLDHRRDVTDMTTKYSVLVFENSGEPSMKTPREIQRGRRQPKGEPQKSTPFFVLTIWGRLLVMAVLCGLLALILVYNNTGGDTGFERFMDSESLGVRLVFTTVGIIITLFWTSYFNCK